MNIVEYADIVADYGREDDIVTSFGGGNGIAAADNKDSYND